MNQHLPASKIAEALLLRPAGATMDDLIAATGGPQYNVLRRLKARGFVVRSEKEGRRSRYFATAPSRPHYDVAVSKRGQVTIPVEVREALKLGHVQKIRFTIGDDGSVTLSAARKSIADLFGILGKPPRSLTIDEMEEAIGQAAVERYLRSIDDKAR